MAGVFTLCQCIPDTPVDDDPRKEYSNRWQISMGHAPAEEPGYFLFGALCSPCATYMLRKRALQNRMENYQCCQGYISCLCFKAGVLQESSQPELCLALESCCCLSCAVSATRFYMADQMHLESDPCDNRIIRINNYLQLLDCVCSILAIFVEELRDTAQVIDCVAKCVFCTTVGCMSAQQYRELNHRDKLDQGGNSGQGFQAPMMQPEMSRIPQQAGEGGGQPMQQQYGAYPGQAGAPPQTMNDMSRQDHIPTAKVVKEMSTV